jgi:hypothetical protein
MQATAITTAVGFVVLTPSLAWLFILFQANTGEQRQQLRRPARLSSALDNLPDRAP